MKLTRLALWAALSLWQGQALAAEDSEPPTQESVISMADRYFGMATEAVGTAIVAESVLYPSSSPRSRRCG